MNIHRHSVCALIALSLLAAPGFANAKFSERMTSSELDQEIHIWIKSGMSVDVIAKAARKSGLSPELIAYSLIRSGQPAETVVRSLVEIDPKSASLITAAAIKAAPHLSNVIYATALTSAELDASLMSRPNPLQN
jgi:DNA-binding phage protein